jgi:hypothetical protein
MSILRTGDILAFDIAAFIEALEERKFDVLGVIRALGLS